MSLPTVTAPCDFISAAGRSPSVAASRSAIARRIAFALDLVRFEVYRADVIDGEPAALARADVDENAVVVEADAAMAVVVDDIGLLQHADAVDELCFELGL